MKTYGKTIGLSDLTMLIKKVPPVRIYHLILLCLYLGLVSSIVLASTLPSAAHTIHENPMALTTSQSVNLDELSQSLMQSIMANLDDISRTVANGQYNESREYYKKLALSFGQYQTLMRQLNLSAADYQNITDNMNLTGIEISTLINTSEFYKYSLSNYTYSVNNGDSANASIFARQIQDNYSLVSSTYSGLKRNATNLEKIFQGSNIDVSSFNDSIKNFDTHMRDLNSSYNKMGFGINGSTLRLSSNRDLVQIGDSIRLSVILSDRNKTAIPNATVTVILDDHMAGALVTDSLGTGFVDCSIPRNVSSDHVHIVAQYLPFAGVASGADSNEVYVNVTSLDTYLDLTMAVSNLTYLDQANVSGYLTAVNGIRAPGKAVSFSLDGRPPGDATTDENGSLSYSFTLQPDMTVGSHILHAVYNGSTTDAFRGSSTDIEFNATALNTMLTLTPVANTYALGDMASIGGMLSTAGGIPVPGVNVSINIDGIYAGNGTTNKNGDYNASIHVPYILTPGSHDLYAAIVSSPNGSLGASSAGPVSINLTDSGKKIVVKGMSPLLFKGEPVNVTGTLTTGNGMPIPEKSLNFSLNGLVNTVIETGERGDFNVQNISTDNATPGLYTLMVSDGNSTAVLYSGSALLSPFGRMATYGVIILLILLVLIIAVLVYPRVRRKPEKMVKPTVNILKAEKELPQAPMVPVFNFEDEVASTKSHVASGDLKTALTNIYLASRKIASIQGVDVKDSMTHVEFYSRATYEIPSLSMPLRRIVNGYEKAIYANEEITVPEINCILVDLGEISKIIGQKREGNGQ